jgi:hypothetical protein
MRRHDGGLSEYRGSRRDREQQQQPAPKQRNAFEFAEALSFFKAFLAVLLPTCIGSLLVSISHPFIVSIILSFAGTNTLGRLYTSIRFLCCSDSLAHFSLKRLHQIPDNLFRVSVFSLQISLAGCFAVGFFNPSDFVLFFLFAMFYGSWFVVTCQFVFQPSSLRLNLLKRIWKAKDKEILALLVGSAFASVLIFIIVPPGPIRAPLRILTTSILFSVSLRTAHHVVVAFLNQSISQPQFLDYRHVVKLVDLLPQTSDRIGRSLVLQHVLETLRVSREVRKTLLSKQSGFKLVELCNDIITRHCQSFYSVSSSSVIMDALDDVSSVLRDKVNVLYSIQILSALFSEQQNTFSVRLSSS